MGRLGRLLPALGLMKPSLPYRTAAFTQLYCRAFSTIKELPPESVHFLLGIIVLFKMLSVPTKWFVRMNSN